ncbi:MAG: Dihydroorotase [uncultured Chloroflexi bacterium]|uniref:Dihydroorotase n=1 Tax=uncultured Chloroflexota bacterium TaxID=166587 RepID=A0A6J4K162_9CHLR|nr:MAG: Dihydroorotase [uncultured Chloroflexota bacterium]
MTTVRAETTADTATYDLLLRGGHVIDPANGLDGPADVAINGKTIARVAPGIDASRASRVVDVSGLHVTPGLIDIHVHVFPHKGPGGPGWQASVIPDAHSFRAGVTTFVDAGTSGPTHFELFKSTWIDTSRTRILAFVNIARDGMGDNEQEPSQFDPQRAAETVRAYPELCVGIKTAHFWTKLPWDDVHTPWASVDAAVQAGELADVPVMVDFWPRPPERSYPDLLLKHMRPGDIHTHVFAQQFPILTEEGPARQNARVADHMWKARERGVYFDLGHGGGSFWFRNALPAIQQGFPPDSISTDLHMGSVNAAVLNTLHTASKCLAMGMPLQEVIYRSTVTPAREIRRPELGTLSEGAEADVAVLRHLDVPASYIDCGRARLDGRGRLECAMTLRAGQVVWDPSGLSMPHWQQAPERYWVVPSLQG